MRTEDEHAKPPTYVVVFESARRIDAEDDGYEPTAQALAERVRALPGFRGMTSLRDASGRGITVSYWDSVEAIAAWGTDPSHVEAKRRGARQWYESYRIAIARIEQFREKP